jgi:hypothetical protein
VTPRVSMNNVVHRAAVNAKANREVFGTSALLPQVANLKDLSSCENRVVVTFACGLVGCEESPLADGITDVLKVGAKPQVRGVAARRVVTFVKHMQPSGNLVIREQPRYSVCKRRAFCAKWPQHRAYAKLTVRRFVEAATQPQPALIRVCDCHLRPEVRFKVGYLSHRATQTCDSSKATDTSDKRPARWAFADTTCGGISGTRSVSSAYNPHIRQEVSSGV